jgi:hypothetical protein
LGVILITGLFAFISVLRLYSIQPNVTLDHLKLHFGLIAIAALIFGGFATYLVGRIQRLSEIRSSNMELLGELPVSGASSWLVFSALVLFLASTYGIMIYHDYYMSEFNKLRNEAGKIPPVGGSSTEPEIPPL